MFRESPFGAANGMRICPIVQMEFRPRTGKFFFNSRCKRIDDSEFCALVQIARSDSDRGAVTGTPLMKDARIRDGGARCDASPAAATFFASAASTARKCRRHSF
jgi:hypothetical protein